MFTLTLLTAAAFLNFPRIPNALVMTLTQNVLHFPYNFIDCINCTDATQVSKLLMYSVKFVKETIHIKGLSEMSEQVSEWVSVSLNKNKNKKKIWHAYHTPHSSSMLPHFSPDSPTGDTKHPHKEHIPAPKHTHKDTHSIWSTTSVNNTIMSNIGLFMAVTFLTIIVTPYHYIIIKEWVRVSGWVDGRRQGEAGWKGRSEGYRHGNIGWIWQGRVR